MIHRKRLFCGGVHGKQKNITSHPKIRVIETKFSTTNPTVTSLVQKLKADGLVKWILNPEDKRSKVPILTEQGIEMKEKWLELFDNLEQQMTVSLIGKESDQLNALLTKLLY